MKGQRHAGTREKGRDLRERDAHGHLHDGSENRSPIADGSDHPQNLQTDDLDGPNTRDVPSTAAEKPDLIVDSGDYPDTARRLRDVLAASGHFFDRGVPVKIGPPPMAAPPPRWN